MFSTEFKNFASQCGNIQFWQALCPDCTINETSPLIEQSLHRLNQGEWQKCSNTLKEDGYFHYTQQLIEPDLINRMANCIMKLHTCNIHPAFCFVYDEFWKVICHLDPLISTVMGKDFLVIASTYAWYVTAENNTGFKPHRDNYIDDFIDKDGFPNYLTIWIPLTDTTPLNSCIYILPTSRDFGYQNNIREWPPANFKEDWPESVREFLKDVQALPAKAGTVLGWNLRLLHWGSRASHFAEEPRISIAFYVQRRTSKLFPPRLEQWPMPVIDYTMPLSLPMRLGLVGLQILCFAGRESNREDYEDLRRLSQILVWKQALPQHKDTTKSA